MFNLLISSAIDSWNSSPYELEKSRSCIEYTADEISERYKFFNEIAIKELKSFPSVFVTEHENTPSKIGYITDIKVRKETVVIHFEFDQILPELPSGTIEKLRVDIDLGRWELSRTHWAVKDENILDILLKKGFINEEQLKASQQLRVPIVPNPEPKQTSPGTLNTSQVFIVHGHDEIVKMDMATFITSMDLEPIILHLQASSGRTIIEKIEAYSNVGFAVVLYTPCDVGAKKGELNYSPRARQNVVFEHGYLIAKLGRPRVAALVKGKIETPNDISGVVYITLDDKELWKDELKKEMRSVGYKV